MTITTATVEAINDSLQQLPVTPTRLAELPVELGQFADAIARMRRYVTFDQDPSAFRREMLAAGAAAVTGPGR